MCVKFVTYQIYYLFSLRIDSVRVNPSM